MAIFAHSSSNLRTRNFDAKTQNDHCRYLDTAVLAGSLPPLGLRGDLRSEKARLRPEVPKRWLLPREGLQSAVGVLPGDGIVPAGENDAKRCDRGHERSRLRSDRNSLPASVMALPELSCPRKCWPQARRVRASDQPVSSRRRLQTTNLHRCLHRDGIRGRSGE